MGAQTCARNCACILLLYEDAVRGQRPGADKHPACAVIAWAPIMLAAIKRDGLSCQGCHIHTDLEYMFAQLTHTE